MPVDLKWAESLYFRTWIKDLELHYSLWHNSPVYDPQKNPDQFSSDQIRLDHIAKVGKLSFSDFTNIESRVWAKKSMGNAFNFEPKLIDWLNITTFFSDRLHVHENKLCAQLAKFTVIQSANALALSYYSWQHAIMADRTNSGMKRPNLLKMPCFAVTGAMLLFAIVVSWQQTSKMAWQYFQGSPVTCNDFITLAVCIKKRFAEIIS